MASECDVNDPKLPWQRKCPARYEEGRAPAEFHTTVKEFYRQIYYEALDSIVELSGTDFTNRDIGCTNA